MAAHKSVLKISLNSAFVAGMVVAWILAKRPFDNYFIFIFSALIAIFYAARFIRKRNLPQLAMFLPWAGLYLFMVIAVNLAKTDAFSLMGDASKNADCGALACLTSVNSKVVKIGGSEGWMIKRLGVNIFVKFSRHGDRCSLSSDYFFGGEKVESWHCEDGANKMQ